MVFFKINCLRDVFPILKILKKQKMFNFKHNVPLFFIEIVNKLLWSIFYKAKLLSKCRGKKKIDIIDIKLAMILKYRKNSSDRVFSTDVKHIASAVGSRRFFFQKRKKSTRTV